ncbi:MAG: oligosaccharide flippase family protein [Phycisphaerales bacterium]|nr:oligosaccharide flippase family protein [Phycisphaerales bacterium]
MSELDANLTNGGGMPGPSKICRVAEKVKNHRFAKQLQGDGLRAKALRGSGWTIAGFGAQQILRLGSTLILTRLLFPEAYGLMMLANVFMTGLHMFSDLGIRPSIIHNKRGHDPDFLNTAWTMQVTRGFALWAFACGVAYPLSLVYEEPMLFPLLCVIGTTAAINGFQTTAYATMNKKVALGKLTLLELITQGVGVVTTVVWAAYYPTVWALVGGGLVSAVISVWFGFRLLPTHKHRMCWDKHAVHELVRFGKWIFLSTIMGFFANQGDRLILGHFMPMAELGMYAIALNWASMPRLINSKLSDKVMLPVYSAHQDTSPHLMRPKIARMRWAVCGMLLPISFLFIIFGKEIIYILYDDRYRGAGWILQVLSVGFAWFVATNIGPFFLAQGRSRLFMIFVIIKSSIAILSMTVGGYIGGGPGIVFGVAIANVFYYPFQVGLYRHFKLWIWKQDVLFLGLVILAGSIAVYRA